jgi:NADPH2:quinone reductase
MVNAVIMHETGGPEVLRWETYDPGQPKTGEILL